LLEEKLLQITTTPNNLGITGAVLSFVFAGTMSAIMLSSKQAYSQVRPRMLLVLALLDTFQAIFAGLDNIKQIRGNYSLFDIAHYDIVNDVGFFLFLTFLNMSLLWTACIAFHVQVTQLTQLTNTWMYLNMDVVSFCSMWFDVVKRISTLVRRLWRDGITSLWLLRCVQI
jgi:hypothetical protein